MYIISIHNHGIVKVSHTNIFFINVEYKVEPYLMTSHIFCTMHGGFALYMFGRHIDIIKAARVRPALARTSTSKHPNPGEIPSN